MKTEFRSCVLESYQILKSTKAEGKTEMILPIDLLCIYETAGKTLMKELIAEGSV